MRSQTNWSTEKKFLCCFCGKIIKTNKNNLNRHERLHADKVTKYKCSAKYCGSTFINKENYYAHWQQKHSISVMPYCLSITYEAPKLKKVPIKISASAKTQIKNCNIDYATLQAVRESFNKPSRYLVACSIRICAN